MTHILLTALQNAASVYQAQKTQGGLRDGLAMGQSIQILKKTLAGANVNKRVSQRQVHREVVLVSSSIFCFGEASFDIDNKQTAHNLKFICLRYF